MLCTNVISNNSQLDSLYIIIVLYISCLSSYLSPDKSNVVLVFYAQCSIIVRDMGLVRGSR